ncbi:hypothetical protein NQ315_009042 [Exocentrus adspersus]|uniref:Uncharacterized protein n=1 Tax=Exocentrus adspersus TaxID=1586481 RepID=A0AAV8VDI6_9CUCU|nr:hypothetical protein NQ315_009042 [Exocentrus adspersus]
MWELDGLTDTLMEPFIISIGNDGSNSSSDEASFRKLLEYVTSSQIYNSHNIDMKLQKKKVTASGIEPSTFGLVGCDSHLCATAQSSEQAFSHYMCRLIPIKILAITCDAPARSFLKCTKSHNGHFGCERNNMWDIIIWDKEEAVDYVPSVWANFDKKSYKYPSGLPVHKVKQLIHEATDIENVSLARCQTN